MAVWDLFEREFWQGKEILNQQGQNQENLNSIINFN